MGEVKPHCCLWRAVRTTYLYQLQTFPRRFRLESSVEGSCLAVAENEAEERSLNGHTYLARSPILLKIWDLETKTCIHTFELPARDDELACGVF